MISEAAIIIVASLLLLLLFFSFSDLPDHIAVKHVRDPQLEEQHARGRRQKRHGRDASVVESVNEQANRREEQRGVEEAVAQRAVDLTAWCEWQCGLRGTCCVFVGEEEN